MNGLVIILNGRIIIVSKIIVLCAFIFHIYSANASDHFSSLEKHKFTPKTFVRNSLEGVLSDHDAFVVPFKSGEIDVRVFNLNLMAGLTTHNAFGVKCSDAQYEHRLESLAEKIAKIVKEYAKDTVFTFQEISLCKSNDAKFAEIFLKLLSVNLGINLAGIVNFTYQNKYGNFIVYNPEKLIATSIAAPVSMETLLTSKKRTHSRTLSYSIFKVLYDGEQVKSGPIKGHDVPEQVSSLYNATGEITYHTQFSRSQSIKFVSKEGGHSFNLLNVHLLRNRDKYGMPNISITGVKSQRKDAFFTIVSSVLNGLLKYYDIIVGDFNLSGNPADLKAIQKVGDGYVRYIKNSHVTSDGKRCTTEICITKK
ncbi:MAG: hypothetical protein ACPGXY_06045 [Alphaproteobacteria bacterium]